MERAPHTPCSRFGVDETIHPPKPLFHKRDKRMMFSRRSTPGSVSRARPSAFGWLWAAGIWSVAASSVQAQQSIAVSPRGPMGGGFIEFVMTGRTAPPQAALPQGGNTLHPLAATALAPQNAPALRAPRPALVLAPEPSAQPDSAQKSRLASLEEVAARPSKSVVRAATPGRFARQEVAYSGPHGPGTIVIDTNERLLYLVQEEGKALRYGIGVGRPGFEWAGTKSVTLKREWPDWRPPEEMRKRRPDLPDFMEGGPNNPLGARALYLGSSLYRIHGTNEPKSIGHAVSSGCIRMRNADVIDLYDRVRVGTRVIVIG